MKSLQSIAKEKTTKSDLYLNREKISTDTLLSKYPEGVTIKDFDKVGDYFVITFLEDDKFFYNCGSILNEILCSYTEQYDSINLAREDYKKTLQLIKIKLENKRNITNTRSYIAIEIC